MAEHPDDGRIIETRGRDTAVVTTHHQPVDAVDEGDRAGLDAARSRYGGLDVPASLAGTLVALAMLLLLAGLASAAFGVLAFNTETTDLAGNVEELTLGALIAAGVVIFLAFVIGGWSAGRMSRYNGALNGSMVAVWFVVLMVILAILGVVAGDTYNLFDNLRVAEASLPNWFSTDDVTTGALVELSRLRRGDDHRRDPRRHLGHALAPQGRSHDRRRGGACRQRDNGRRRRERLRESAGRARWRSRRSAKDWSGSGSIEARGSCFWRSPARTTR